MMRLAKRRRSWSLESTIPFFDKCSGQCGDEVFDSNLKEEVLRVEEGRAKRSHDFT